MGLYLCIFDNEDELDGVEVGQYSDFSRLRNYISKHLEGGAAGEKYPTFIMHSDCDGEWSASECSQLIIELDDIISIMKSRPPLEFGSDWQITVAKSTNLVPINAFESFIDVDGEFVLARIRDLVVTAIHRQLPIIFQ